MTFDNLTGHISQRFDDELDAVKSQLTEMGGIVEKQVSDAIAALLNADPLLAEKVVKKSAAPVLTINPYKLK